MLQIKGSIKAAETFAYRNTEPGASSTYSPGAFYHFITETLNGFINLGRSRKVYLCERTVNMPRCD